MMNKVLLGALAIALCVPFAAIAAGDDEAEDQSAAGGRIYRVDSVGDVVQEDGILIGRVIEDSPAERAGIIRGDIVLAVDATEVNSILDLQTLLAEYEAGETVQVQLSRGGEEMTVALELETRLYRPVFGIEAAGGFGYRFGPIPGEPGRPDMRRGPGYAMPHENLRRGLPGGADQFMFRFPTDPDGSFFSGELRPGDLVRSVADDGPADDAGIMAGDIIVRVGETELDDSTVGDAISELSPGDTVEIEIVRPASDGEIETLVVTATLGENEDGDAYLGIGFIPMRLHALERAMEHMEGGLPDSFPWGFRGGQLTPRAERENIPQGMSL